MGRKQISPILILFILTNIILIGCDFYFIGNTNFKFEFIMGVNLMLFVMSLFNFFRLYKLDASNPNAMVRSVMVGTLLKMLVFAGAALTYATQKKAPVGIPTLVTSMALYLVYTWLEIQWTQKKS
jgi:uncharacterized membrane-anchored protein YitT (DUF2179 family)